MDKSPLISIITITFNAQDEIVPTMESVNSQTFRDFEHIIIDGASRDATLSLARDLGGKNLRILSEPDKGLYDAMNKGIGLARGKYLLFLNAGDAFHSPDILARYATECGKDADIIYADTDIVNAGRERIGQRHLSAPSKLTFESYKNGMLVCHQAFMVKKAIVPLYDLQYRFSADFDWCVKCIKATTPEKCKNLDTVAIDYLSDGMTDKNKIASLKERFNIMAKHYGTVSTVGHHISFIGRAIKRRIL